MSKYVGNLIPHTFFVTKGSGESDLELHAWVIPHGSA